MWLIWWCDVRVSANFGLRFVQTLWPCFGSLRINTASADNRLKFDNRSHVLTWCRRSHDWNYAVHIVRKAVLWHFIKKRPVCFWPPDWKTQIKSDQQVELVTLDLVKRNRSWVFRESCYLVRWSSLSFKSWPVVVNLYKLACIRSNLLIQDPEHRQLLLLQRIQTSNTLIRSLFFTIDTYLGTYFSFIKAGKRRLIYLFKLDWHESDLWAVHFLSLAYLRSRKWK